MDLRRDGDPSPVTRQWIAVPDLVYNATLINADTYRPLEVYTVVALIYFAILFPATLVARRLERGKTYDKA